MSGIGKTSLKELQLLQNNMIIRMIAEILQKKL